MVVFMNIRLMATMNMVGLLAWLAMRAPMRARLKLRIISFLAPYLSVSSPVGIERTVWQRGGMAAMMPSCWRERENSSLRMENMDAFSHVGECVGKRHGDEPVAQEGGCLLFLFLLRDVNSPRVFASLRVC